MSKLKRQYVEQFFANMQHHPGTYIQDLQKNVSGADVLEYIRDLESKLVTLAAAVATKEEAKQ